MTTQARRFHVQGRVQGVGFRYFVVQTAARLGLAGWVHNRRDGSVEVLAQGSPRSLDELASALEQGPPASRVEGVASSAIPVEPSFSGFDVRH